MTIITLDTWQSIFQSLGRNHTLYHFKALRSKCRRSMAYNRSLAILRSTTKSTEQRMQAMTDFQSLARDYALCNRSMCEA